jgi:phage shock protein PspC (stress-responsive transcriptional regulator)
MTETSGPSPTDQQPSTATDGPPPSVDRPHFHSFEQLRRSKADRKVAGVAGGLGRHLNVDPNILRVLFVVMCFFGLSGFLLYGAAWALVPEDGQSDGNISARPGTRNALLIGAGVLAALLVLGDGWGGIRFPWPLFLVGLGVVVYLGFRGRDDRSPQDPSQYPSQYAGQYPPQYASQYPPQYAAPDSTGEQATTQYPWAVAAPEGATGTTYAPQPPAPPWLPPAPAYPPPRPKRGPRLFGLTLAMTALALGALGVYDASGGHVIDSAYPALALAVVGLMLVVGAFVGRAGGLVLLGIVASIALAVTSAVGSIGGLGNGDGERIEVTPLSASAVQNSYYVPSGRVMVDLSDVRDPTALADRTIEVGARAGEVVVILPHGVTTHIDAEISGPGQIDLPGHSSGGIDNELTETLGSGPGTLSLRAHLFAGHIDVRTS